MPAREKQEPHWPQITLRHGRALQLAGGLVGEEPVHAVETYIPISRLTQLEKECSGDGKTCNRGRCSCLHVDTALQAGLKAEVERLREFGAEGKTFVGQKSVSTDTADRLEQLLEESNG